MPTATAIPAAETTAAAGCPNAPKRDPRVRRTRKLLEDALRGLLAEKPYQAISVGDIADRATVNRATFYAHFTDKADLATTLLREDLNDALVASLPPGARFGRESLEKLAVAVFRFVARTFSACPKAGDELAPRIAPTLEGAVEDMLRTWLDLDPGAMRHFPEASKDAVATVLAWSLYGGAVRWSEGGRKAPAERAAAEIVRLLLR